MRRHSSLSRLPRPPRRALERLPWTHRRTQPLLPLGGYHASSTRRGRPRRCRPSSRSTSSLGGAYTLVGDSSFGTTHGAKSSCTRASRASHTSSITCRASSVRTLQGLPCCTCKVASTPTSMWRPSATSPPSFGPPRGRGRACCWARRTSCTRCSWSASPPGSSATPSWPGRGTIRSGWRLFAKSSSAKHGVETTLSSARDRGWLTA
mmetsp:Transcript_26728/g.67598  ORF Transcript_26728/g.67598 Transcript_26728/m.67598 type:complete len:207 (+) Transcript_26728:408-1028(+)